MDTLSSMQAHAHNMYFTLLKVEQMFEKIYTRPESAPLYIEVVAELDRANPFRNKELRDAR